MNLYAFVANDPLIHIDLYGLYANPWMFPPRTESSEQAFKGMTSGTWNYATKTLTSFAGHNDGFVHWNLQKEYRQYQQREISREYINKSSRDWFVNKIGADINSRTFQGFEKWTERALWAVTAYYAGKNVVSLVKQEISFNKYFQASRSFWNQPVKTYELGSFSTNRAYSGLDVERIVKDVKNNTQFSNKINHIFGQSSINRHKLKVLLDEFKGDKVAAFNSLRQETQKLATKGIIKNIFEVTVDVKNTKIVVRGKVIKGKVNIGTAYIP